MTHTTLVDGLFRQLRDRGIRVVYDGDDKMHLSGNVAEADEKVLAALKAFRPHILARVKETSRPHPEDTPDPSTAPATTTDPGPKPEWETCRVCKAMVHEAMTPDDARILCNQIGAKGNVARHGFLGIPATDPCPYHPPTSSGRGGR